MYLNGTVERLRLRLNRLQGEGDAPSATAASPSHLHKAGTVTLFAIRSDHNLACNHLAYLPQWQTLLSFEAGQLNPLDEVLLEKQEHYQYWNNSYHIHRHEQIRISHMLPTEEC